MNTDRSLVYLLRWWLLTIVCLVLIGLLFIYAASSIYASERLGDSGYYVKRQALRALLGFAVAGAVFFIPLAFVRRYALLIFGGVLLVTALTLVPGLGVKIHGSRRWVSLLGFSFQPSEMLKYATLLIIAAHAARYEGTARNVIKRYGMIALPVALAAGILLLQPDFGMALTIVATQLLILFIAFPDWRYVVFAGLALLPAVALLVYMEPYRLRRMLVFLDPWADPRGAGFQIIQSLIAIGSGGLCGLGIGNSRQKFFYLPMQHTDFIFSIIAEEIGFLGCLTLFFLFFMFLYLGMRIATSLRDPFARYLFLGFVLLNTLQAVVNICVAIGMFPTKGIGLPLVSYGNSSLLCTLSFLGLLVRAVKEDGETAIIHSR